MHFSNPVLFEIPVLPRIKKFIAVKLADSDGRPQPMLASPTRSGGAGMFLWSLTQSEKVMLQLGWRRNKVNKLVLFDESTGQDIPRKQLLTDNSGRIIAPDDMVSRLGLGICEFHPSRHQYLLNYAELIIFSNYVDYIILNEMACFCLVAPKTPPLKRIKQFCDKYDFSDLDFDERALRQAYYRSQKRVEDSPFGGLNFNKGLLQVKHFQPYAFMAA